MSDPTTPRPSVAALSMLQEHSDALAPGTRLAEFEIREVIGAGGFGIVYRAWDHALERDVALKEYMPAAMAGRGADARITLRSRSHEADFGLGLRSFVNEARLLARFDHPALVKVYRFWEENGTAYMVMPLYRARSLRELRMDMGTEPLTQAWLRALIEPLLGALELIHGADVYHRDIAPDNILWCDDGRPVLLDFGAARHVLADRTQTLTAILKPQFAPIEQYADTQSMRQGPWTDLFALASTCYFMLTGRPPIPATARVLDDELKPLAQLAPAGFSPHVLATLDWAMAVRPQNRPQAVATFRDALSGRIDVPAVVAFGVTIPVAAANPAAFDKTQRLSPAKKATPIASSTGGSVDAATFPATQRTAPKTRRDKTPTPTPQRKAGPARVLLWALAALAVAGLASQAQRHWRAHANVPIDSQTALAAATPTPTLQPASAVASSPDAAAPIASPQAALVAVAAEASAASSQARLAGGATGAHPRSSAARDRTTGAISHRARLDAANAAPARSTQLAAAANVDSAVPAAVSAMPPAAASTSAAADVASAARSVLGPREICAGAKQSNATACIKLVCDNDRRYQHYPICARLHRQEGSHKPYRDSE